MRKNGNDWLSHYETIRANLTAEEFIEALKRFLIYRIVDGAFDKSMHDVFDAFQYRGGKGDKFQYTVHVELIENDALFMPLLAQVIKEEKGNGKDESNT